MKIFITLLTILFSLGLSAQQQSDKTQPKLKKDRTKIDSASYDKVNKLVNKLDKSAICISKNLQIKVTEVNTVLHTVSIKFEDFSWHSDPPKSLDVIFPGLKELEVNLAPDTNLICKNPIIKRDNKGYVRLDSLFTIINKAKAELKKYFNSSTTYDDSTKLFCKCYLQEIGSYFAGEPNVIRRIQNDIAELQGKYEVLLELQKSVNTYDTNIVNAIARDKWNYENLKKNSSKILSGIVALAEGAKSATVISTAESDVHNPKNEVVAVTIHIIDRFNPADTITSYKQDVYRKGKFKIDFSTGIGVNTLVNPTYYIGKIDTVPFIDNEEKRDLDLTVFGLAHFNWRLSAGLSVGPTTGVSISVFDAKPTYLLGGSLTFGKRNSVSVSGGLSLGKIDVLSRKVSSDGVTADLELDPAISTVPTYGKIGVGGFGSITYNFGRTKKK